jgi:hypothetical protein
MKYLRLCLILTAASGIALAANPADGEKSGEATAAKPMPRVLRDAEPTDSVVVRLGAPAPPGAPTLAVPVATATLAKVTEPSVKLDPAPDAAVEDPGKPYLRRSPKVAYPPNFERDSAIYCQKLIGQWSLEDATMLLGEPSASRAAFDDRQKQNGSIWTFSDPTGHYRQIELDFDSDSGTLRTVFGYPWNLTWSECRKLWGGNVNAAEANKGRRFYSYLNRRLDVLVDPSGKVISLGLY